MLTKDNFTFDVRKRNWLGSPMQVLDVYEKGFPFLLYEKFIKDDLFKIKKEFVETENRKSLEQRQFDKLFILFEQKREVEYAVFLAIHHELPNGYNFDLYKEMQKLSQIFCWINFFVTKLQANLPKLIKQRQANITDPLDSTILLMIENYFQQFLQLQNSDEIKNDPI